MLSLILVSRCRSNNTMPICVRDPWRVQYFENTSCPPETRIPVDDMDAWAWNKEHRWIYDRLAVALSQKLPAGPHGAEPDAFPVFSKPITNLKGMGIGSRIIQTRAEYEKTYEAGHFWMPVLTGPHLSTDVAVIDSKIVWARHAIGEPWRDGMFRFWKIMSEQDPSLLDTLTTWCKCNLYGYSGMVNFETIGGTIIEAHLRFADQWCDLYGAGWTDALVKLYGDKVWRFDDSARRDGFSIPLFADPAGTYKHPQAKKQAMIRAMPEISSLQITFHEKKSLDEQARPPGGMRLALINSWTLRGGIDAIKQVATCFPAENLIIR